VQLEINEEYDSETEGSDSGSEPSLENKSDKTPQTKKLPEIPLVAPGSTPGKDK